jgi:TolB protein
MNQDADVQIGAPVLSPTEDLLVFTELVEGGSCRSKIYKLVPGQQPKISVTQGAWLDLYPCFSADGESLLFSSNRTSQNRTLWRVPIGAGAMTKLTDSFTDDYAPSVSPDGAKVVYASRPRTDVAPQIWAIEAGFPVQLREGDQPAVSPDGRRIAFIRQDRASGRKQLWLMNGHGGEETQLSANTEHDVIDPRWSPDGEWLVFASDEGRDSEGRHNFDIWAVRPDGSDKTQLTTNGSRDDSPCWDHTGTFVYFRSNRGKAWNIWRFKPLL